MLGMALIHVVAAIVKPPARYPDLITYAFTTYSFFHFVAFYIGYNVLQWSGSAVTTAPIADRRAD
eukprot:NODE_9299_length_323_cov_83.948905_g7533_i0.p2 GENE.NODE_9299_length_323_cov_83.948905_g7533_i0~~NODE_9299_length_323_cov_83.948905_g7533_i0.p2  ORF type:complete len:65 (-),score=9.14 NODE_9299_length_323_cov_83.948905_g7533_i0:74-268(-)